MSQERVTIADIAEMVGVTAGTVSRAIRGDSRVNVQTRRRIMEIVERLNYRPNLSARSLKTGTIGSLALACSTGAWVLHHPYFAPMHSGFITAAAAEGVRVTIFVPPPDGYNAFASKSDWPMEMMTGLVDGCLIYQAQTRSLESIRSLVDSNLAVVLMNTDREIPGFFQVLANAEERIRESVRWAGELGAKRVGVLGLSARMQRFNGAALEGASTADCGAAVDFETVPHDDPDNAEALDAAIGALMAQGPGALVFTSGVALMRFIRARDAGLYPADVALFYHEADHEFAPWALPGVRYMVADLLGAGRLAYAMIKEAREGKPPRSEPIRWRRRP